MAPPVSAAVEVAASKTPRKRKSERYAYGESPFAKIITSQAGSFDDGPV